MTAPFNPFAPPPAKPRAWQALYDEEDGVWVVVRFDASGGHLVVPTKLPGDSDATCERRARELCAALNRVYGLLTTQEEGNAGGKLDGDAGPA